MLPPSAASTAAVAFGVCAALAFVALVFAAARCWGRSKGLIAVRAADLEAAMLGVAMATPAPLVGRPLQPIEELAWDAYAEALDSQEGATTFGRTRLERVRSARGLEAVQRCLEACGPSRRADARDGHAADSRLSVAAAWSVDDHLGAGRYGAARERLARRAAAEGAPPATLLRSDGWATLELGLQVDASINEKLLMHGTRPECLRRILTSGLDEKICGGAFRKGTHLTEDAGKCDQLCTVEEGKNASDLHQALYPGETRHPGDVCYLLLCRALLGHTARTADGERTLEGGPVWASPARRELAPIPGSKPAEPHNALLVEMGSQVAGYREVVVYHKQQVLTHMLVAYQRY